MARPGTVLVHLRKGLAGSRRLAARGRRKAARGRAEGEAHLVKPLAGDFGISMDAQRLLSRVRTDLDSFSDTEAFALMLDGYSMTDFVLNRDARFAEFLAKARRSARRCRSGGTSARSRSRRARRSWRRPTVASWPSPGSGSSSRSCWCRTRSRS